MSLRVNMFKLSEKHPQMAIFLAKNWLGMTDSQELAHSGDEKPIILKVVIDDGEKETKSQR
jgi:hypothetical protein